MEKGKITTIQYATAHKKVNEAQLKGLLKLLDEPTNEYERQIIIDAIKGCEGWIKHYDNMINGKDDEE